MALSVADAVLDLLDASPMAVVVHDEGGRVRHANAAFARLLGYSLSEVLDLDMSDLVLASADGSHPADVADPADPADPFDEPGTAVPQPDPVPAAVLAGARHPAVREHRAEVPAPRSSSVPSPSGSIADRRMVHRSGRTLRCRTTTSTVDRDGRRLVLMCVEDVAAHERVVERLRHAATHDTLTGLTNRAGMSRHLQDVARSGRVVDVAMVDLDGLKLVNDTLGHLAGDRLLVAVAGFLTAGLPAGCEVSRWAGDEFVVTGPVRSGHGPDPAPDAAGIGGPDTGTGHFDLAAALRRCLRAEVEVAPEVTVAVRASVGVSRCGGGRSPAEALAAADEAMYAMKHARARRGSAVPEPRRP
ncbi:hypothetical protein GCM10011594_05340 [Nakamurella endophytica]|uniref:PAS domain S-box-containing protein/diguanylate cyclase (GGDEF)-like protein n=2 Tax=Nakamurella endophytica TaxID=1748367 RepID=A0A917WC18_9ACTN|nr:hypothetical protein GCM10011594_05340 [Nakamurella endophytica]